MKFEPMGITNNNDIKIANSIIDYIFRYLAYRFLSSEELKQLGLLDKNFDYLRQHPTLFENESFIKNQNNELPGPPCKYCGGITQRTGSCYTCTNCGESSGGCS
jgi:ribonucleoside-diphosphate reductase alpha chain